LTEEPNEAANPAGAQASQTAAVNALNADFAEYGFAEAAQPEEPAAANQDKDKEEDNDKEDKRDKEREKKKAGPREGWKDKWTSNQWKKPEGKKKKAAGKWDDLGSEHWTKPEEEKQKEHVQTNAEWQDHSLLSKAQCEAQAQQRKLAETHRRIKEVQDSFGTVIHEAPQQKLMEDLAAARARLEDPPEKAETEAKAAAFSYLSASPVRLAP
jgi:hypothetical protein